MKRYIVIILVLLLPLVAAACGNNAKGGESGTIQDVEVFDTNSSPKEDNALELETEPELESADAEETETEPESVGVEDDTVKTDQLYIKVGQSTLTAALEDNESAEALKKLLAGEPLTISASNYGGFEKVCSLGTKLPRNDSQTTTHAGDICLYNGNQIVIFYGSNSWAYTRLGEILDEDASELETVLSGEETEITLSLEAFQ
ncbi:MAG: cyclophilin-like fold protein [Blautia sp.]|nr:cyclophilin-like fold protein [Blautia sp.]MCM1201269.1 cyclophilin-like fold protein [Bacteroides fragilis]